MFGSSKNLSRKLIGKNLAEGRMEAGAEIGLRADQALLQDVLGTLVMLELEAMEADRVKIGVAVQYVDHNLLEVDNLNQEEHLFLRSACRRYGVWYSRPGTGISHPTHMQRFGKPGEVLVGCDSHTTAAGSLGMFAVGMGGLDVALAMVGDPFYIRMPEIWGVELTGTLPDWVSAKDVALEMLRRHGVEGAFGRVVEYYGPGLACLSAMDRHVIANMGAEMGATTTVFPSDDRTREFLRNVGREGDWVSLAADKGADYDHHDTIDLGALEPMIATPSSPGNVVRVRDVPKVDVYQTYIGSSANPGYRDYAVAAEMVKGRTAHDRVSFDINPSTRQVFEQLVADGHMARLIESGARVHQPGCNGCIGMGQAPARGRPSLRTVPRNFPGRSGTKEDSVYLCSPETAAASALTGMITDPRDLGLPYSKIDEPVGPDADQLRIVPPVSPGEGRATRLEKTDNIVSLPKLDKPGDDLSVAVLLNGGRRHLDGRHHAGGRSGPAVMGQHAEGGRLHISRRGRRLSRTRQGDEGEGRNPRDRRRSQLRAGVEPRERRAGAAHARPATRGGQELRAHPLAEPHQLRRAATDLLWFFGHRPPEAGRQDQDRKVRRRIEGRQRN